MTTLSPLEEAWSDFLASREFIKKPPSPVAVKKLRNKLAILSHGNERLAIAILDQSSERGYLGLFPLNEQNAEMFRVAEADRVRNRKIECTYCGASIKEVNRIEHEDNECPKFRAQPKGDVLDAVRELGDKWRGN